MLSLKVQQEKRSGQQEPRDTQESHRQKGHLDRFLLKGRVQGLFQAVRATRTYGSNEDYCFKIQGDLYLSWIEEVLVARVFSVSHEEHVDEHDEQATRTTRSFSVGGALGQSPFIDDQGHEVTEQGCQEDHLRDEFGPDIEVRA